MFGSVLCSPGCFSVYRARAIRDVLPLYAGGTETAMDFLMKDMGTYSIVDDKVYGNSIFLECFPTLNHISFVLSRRKLNFDSFRYKHG